MRRFQVFHVLPVLTSVAACATTLLANQGSSSNAALGVAATVLSVVALLGSLASLHRWRTETRAADDISWLRREDCPPDATCCGDTLLVGDLLTKVRTSYREQQHQLTKAQSQVESYDFLTRHIDDMLIQVNCEGTIQQVSSSLQQHLGYSSSEVLGRRAKELIHADDQTTWWAELRLAGQQRRSALLEARWRHRDGSWVLLEFTMRHAYDDSGQVVQTVGVARNIEVRSVLRAKLEQAARTDVLTGLLNRAALVETLETMRVKCDEAPFGLFLFDLDRFKQVNDSLGHNAGDEYLIETARRVSLVLRETDLLARMGGDEFVVLFADATSETALLKIADRIVAEVGKPFQCHGELLFPKTSIGVLMCNDPAIGADELVSRADRAMYVAKAQGGNLAVVYDTSQADILRKSFAIEQELTQALEENRLAVQFQPIVDAKSKCLVSAEALVRLRGVDGQLIAPGHFIEVAEKSGLIFQVGTWVLKQACLQSQDLVLKGYPSSISVNVSPRQLMHINYVQSVERVLAETCANPRNIVLEVTESAVMQDVNRALSVLLHLKSLGFRLALDDFGSGYSSISMLKSLPFDILKIDRAFAAEAGGSTIGPSTLASIIDIGKSLNLTLVAEGVETPAQSLGLERLGCDLLQGFLFHRPLDAEAYLDVVRNNSAQLVTGKNLKATADDIVLF